MQTQKGVFPPQRDPVRGGTTLLVGIIIIVVAVIAVGGVLAYQYFSTKTQPVVQTQQNQNKNNQTAQPSINVTSPKGGETWKIGETYNITWNSSGLNNINIGTSAGGSNLVIASGVVASQGSYAWTIPNTFTVGNYILTLSSINGSIIVNSNTFSIVAPTNQTVSQQLSDIAIISAINKLEGIQFKQNAQGTYAATRPGGQNYTINLITKGDLNGDGFQDAVVSGLGCGASCGSTFIVVINKNGNSTGAFFVDPGGFVMSGANQYGIKNISINNGILTINANIYNGASTTVLPLNYKLVGENLVKI